jgi:hypothetical protein
MKGQIFRGKQALLAESDTREQFDGKGLGAFLIQGIPQKIGQQFMGLGKIDDPDDPVLVEFLMIGEYVQSSRRVGSP